MLFNTLDFLVFFIIVFTLYYSARSGLTQLWILIFSSLCFYAYTQPIILFLLVFSALGNGIIAKGIVDSKRKDLLVFWGIFINLLVLGLFKYNRLIGDLIGISPDDDWFYNILYWPLPIGISFYTFQGISMILDLIRNKNNLLDQQREEKHLIRNTFFYIIFFPQLIAGPVVKAHDFLSQITYKEFNSIAWEKALEYIIIGYFLKVVIADNLSAFTFHMEYPYFITQSSLTLLVMLLGYSIQIFSDFAGYSSIAIGLSLILGYKIPANFNYPYIADSISDFWRRWHISLSTWLRDYLYLPLGGNRKGHMRTYLNLVIVMTLGGLWHGASLKFVVWGLFHGLLLVLERPFLNTFIFKKPLFRGLRIVIVFSLVSYAWLFFKLDDFMYVVEYSNSLFSNWSILPNKFNILVMTLLMIPVFAAHLLILFKFEINKRLRGLSLGFMLFCIIFAAGDASGFIYFQF